MKNSIFNEYGALDHNGIGLELDSIVNQYETNLTNFINRHNLSPIEIRCVQAYISQNTSCATEVLRKAMKMRKEKKS